tara:strand:- start:489 stop:758 length:270 start_codon:yes stop_codon:yes gene_type:complete
LLALVADVLAPLAEVLAADALAAASSADVSASRAFAVTALIVISVFASPAPPSPRNIAIAYSLFGIKKRKEQPPKELPNLILPTKQEQQ